MLITAAIIGSGNILVVAAASQMQHELLFTVQVVVLEARPTVPANMPEDYELLMRR